MIEVSFSLPSIGDGPPRDTFFAHRASLAARKLGGIARLAW
jgi:hypothetical protein